jgi:signal transduction histidine kinase
LLNKIINLITNYKKNIFHENKDRVFINIIDQIEEDFDNIILKEVELIERNQLLLIINNISKLINNEIYFNPILFKINKILLSELNFYKGAFYLYNIKDGKFKLNFELDNKDTKDTDINEFDLSNIKISLAEYQDIKKISFPMVFEEFNKNIKLIQKKQLKVLKSFRNNLIYMIPIEISEDIFGFYLLFSLKKLSMSENIINELFENIKEQLRIGYEKISSRNIIENILSSIPASVLIFNIDDYQIRYINDIFISIFPEIQNKYTKNDIIGMELFSLPHFTNHVKTTIKNFIKRKPLDGEIERHEINLGSNIIEYYLFLISQNNETGRFAGIIMNDITEAKYFQEHLFNNEKLIALGKVASGIAHEINNPLYAILADAEELADLDGIDKESKKLAEEIVELVMIVSNIIRDLSVYSKTLRKEDLVDVNLNSIINESLKLVKYGSNFLEIDAIKELSDIPTIKATKGEMQQVFINLLNNAVDAMGGKGVLKITSEYKDSKILISVFDTGCGIKKSDQKYIFDLFFTTKEPGKGTGQGLHIVKRILNKYNALIDFNSEVDRGTKFYLTFQVK